MAETVSIVTGASTGIGKATACRLARDFGAVVLVSRGGDDLSEVRDQVKAIGADPLAIELDLMVPTAAQTVIRTALERFGRIDALLNIAGAVAGLGVFEMTDAQWTEGLELKLHGAPRLTVHAWEALSISKGSVVFISGTSASAPKASAAAVGAINAAIEALAKAFADCGVRDGVQVNSVSPGAVMTGRRLAMLEKAAALQTITLEEAKQHFLQQAGITRFGEPEEVADLLAFLVSPAARWITGSVLRMDGGELRSI